MEPRSKFHALWLLLRRANLDSGLLISPWVWGVGFGSKASGLGFGFGVSGLGFGFMGLRLGV